jgi:uncharacterized MAPEG superfamily protein
MTTLLHDQAFQLYAFSCAILIAVLYALAFFTGKVRDRSRAVVNAEDAPLYHGAAVVEFEHPDVQRVKRAHLNLIENAVPFFVIGLLYALTGPSVLTARVLFFSFVAARLLHVFCYLTARQPWRAASWMFGVLVTLVMLVQVVRASLG